MENKDKSYSTLLDLISIRVEPWCEDSESTTLEAVECLIQELNDIKILLAKEWVRNV